MNNVSGVVPDNAVCVASSTADNAVCVTSSIADNAVCVVRFHWHAINNIFAVTAYRGRFFFFLPLSLTIVADHLPLLCLQKWVGISSAAPVNSERRPSSLHCPLKRVRVSSTALITVDVDLPSLHCLQKRVGVSSTARANSGCGPSSTAPSTKTGSGFSAALATAGC